MKILLINPSYRRTYGSNQAGIANPVYPILSLAALAGIAKSYGHICKILDLSFQIYDPDYIKSYILKERPDIVAVTGTTPLANQMRDISFLVKDISKDILTVVGGAHASALPAETLKESMMDIVAVGEADFTFRDIIEGKPTKDIEGIYWRKDDEIIANPSRELIGCLDDLPMPAWELYPIKEYKKRMTKILCKKPPLTTIEFSRGCVFKCDFCGSKNTMGLGYRKKSPERCSEEMAYLKKIGYREALLTDDIFTSDNAWAIKVCDAISKRNLNMAWTCTNGIRVDSAKKELFIAMKRAGCYRVHFGFESGSDKVLKAFGKGGKATLKQGIRAVDSARSAGLDTWGMFMVGLSGDTEQTMQETIEYACKVKVDIKKLGITVPFPGTPMFNQLHSNNKIKTYNWDDYNLYNDVSPIFDHPNLSWDIIQKVYKDAYLKIYFKSPIYILRRFWRGMKTGEFFWDLYFGVRFLFVLLKKSEKPHEEKYVYDHLWKKLNIRPNELNFYQAPIVKKSTRQKKTDINEDVNQEQAVG